MKSNRPRTNKKLRSEKQNGHTKTSIKVETTESSKLEPDRKPASKPQAKSKDHKNLSQTSQPTQKKTPIQTTSEMKTLLQIEQKMAALNVDIKKSLTQEKANTEICIRKLTIMKEITPDITKIMLLKNPNSVDTIKKLKRYIGNTSNWILSGRKVSQFVEEATKIRDLADEIYDDFKNTLGFTGKDELFWKHFTTAVGDFECRTKNLSEKEFKVLCYEENFERVEKVGSETEENKSKSKKHVRFSI